MSWEAGWVVWLVVTAVTFAAMEWATLRRHETLSENIRRWLGIEPRKPFRRVGVPLFVAVVLGFVAWFIPHIVNWA